MGILREFRYAFRTARLNPLFTLTVVLTLALCVGANTAIFSVIDTVLLRPLPYPEPDRLAQVVTRMRGGGAEGLNQAQDGRMWETIRDGVKLADTAVYSGWAAGVNLTLGQTAAFVQQQRVGTGFFRVLGVPPALGREFAPEEDQPGGPPVAVLSYRLWQRAFGGGRSVIGQPLMLRGEPYTVIGVMPAGFQGSAAADVWTPLRPSRRGEGGGTNYSIVARLRPGVSWARANAEVEAVGQGRWRERPPQPGVTVWSGLMPLKEGQTQSVRLPLLVLWAAVGAVLLIGCVNIAGMLLARGTARAREIATRIALGGGRAAVVRQLLAESAVLAVFGAVAGTVAGWLALRGLKALAGETFPFVMDASLDARVLGALAGIALLTSLLFGLFPALQLSRVDIRTALAGGRGVAGRRSFRSMAALVAGQVALAVPLLIGAGLLTRTLSHLAGLDPGFDPRNIVAAGFSLQDARYGTAGRINQLFQQSLVRLRETPGVEAAAVALTLPYERPLNLPLWLRETPRDRPQITNLTYVTSGYFETLRIPLRRGRVLSEADGTGAPKVAVVNEAFVRKFFPRQEALGATVNFGGEMREIAGVVGDVLHRPSFGADLGPLAALQGAYVPAAQMDDGALRMVHTWFSPSWIVRSTRPPAELRALLDSTARSVDPLLPIARFHTLDEVKARSLGWQRLLATLLSVLAGLAAALAVVGVYATIANSVIERTREMGIRMALGARVAQAVTAVARPGVILAAAGVAVGCVLARLGAGLLQRLVWGVSTTDRVTFVAVVVGTLALAAAASLIPALRIARLNPARTLREE